MPQSKETDWQIGYKAKTHRCAVSRKISSKKQGRPIFNSRKYREHHKDNPQEEQPQSDIIVRFTRVEMKEKILRAAREKGRVTHKGKPIRLMADLSAETLQARREWGPIFNILKEKNFQPRISYPAKLSFISKGKIKSFANKQVLKDFVTTRPALQDLLKEALYIERNTQYQPF